jgi:hypothetical protein
MAWSSPYGLGRGHQAALTRQARSGDDAAFDRIRPGRTTGPACDGTKPGHPRGLRRFAAVGRGGPETTDDSPGTDVAEDAVQPPVRPLLEKPLREAGQVLAPLRGIMAVGVDVPDVRHVVLLEIGVHPLADADQAGRRDRGRPPKRCPLLFWPSAGGVWGPQAPPRRGRPPGPLPHCQ